MKYLNAFLRDLHNFVSRLLHVYWALTLSIAAHLVILGAVATMDKPAPQKPKQVIKKYKHKPLKVEPIFTVCLPVATFKE